MSQTTPAIVPKGHHTACECDTAIEAHVRGAADLDPGCNLNVLQTDHRLGAPADLGRLPTGVMDVLSVPCL